MTDAPFEKAFTVIQELVRRFEANEARYLSPGYQEAEVRKDFIDKLWIAFGWDVNHDQQTNPYEQEVKVERGVHTGSARRRADYAFCLAPNFHDVRFFVEAKKPFADTANVDDYFQTVRYGWNAQNPFAVLTDFKEFHILDCRATPDVANVLSRCVAKYSYTEYAQQETLREMYWHFSREAVATGSLEKRARQLPKAPGKARQRILFPGAYKPVDAAFLDDLDEFRTTLARTFKSNNSDLDSSALTELAQRTLDRLVFLRFLEDRGIEPQRVVDEFGDHGPVWDDFVAASKRLDTIYNGVVFKRHDILDDPKFRVDDATFGDICERLASLNTPYDFNSIPLHILGSIYERFLGKVIVATDKRVRVEEKPEVRKAGGVFYTPEYIVRFIVENTVGELIGGRTPEEISSLRLVDIACGSGSFLLGVYDLLLQYHGNYYNANPRKVRKGDCIEHDGKLFLSIQKKRDILLNNVFGVDIDAQAVEVAQLSLYLRMLKEETTGTAHQYLLEFAHTAHMKKLLPDLSKNIVCGNSLVGTEILNGDLFTDEEEERRLNPMDFARRFPGVMARGGFDAVVGNPPYLRMESFKPIKDYLKSGYAVHDERSDYYAYFIERAHRLLKADGRFGMIVSNKFLRANYGGPLRTFLSREAAIERVVDFAGLPVFRGATVRTIVLLTARGRKAKAVTRYSPPPTLERFSLIEDGLLSVEDATAKTSYDVPSDMLSRGVWSFARREVNDLLGNLSSKCTPLSKYCGGKVCMGVKSGLKEAFEIDAETRREILKKNPEAAEIIKPFLNGRDVRRYFIEWPRRYLIYTYHGVPINKYPAIRGYLEQFKARLKKRATSQEWYELQQPQLNFAPYMEGAKLIFPDMAIRPRFAVDDTGFYSANTTYFIPLHDLYLLALLNSTLGHFYFRSVCAGLEGEKETYLRFFGQYLEGFPVFVPDLRDASQKSRHARILRLVEQMVEGARHAARARTDKDKAYHQSKCEAFDHQIDRLIYELYGLTEEQMQVMEGAVAGADGTVSGESVVQ